MCELGNSEIVRILLDHGADGNLCTDEGLNPFYFACFNNQIETVTMLLEHGAKTNIASPLCMMFNFGNAEIVRILLNNGADVNLCTYKEISPLYFACFIDQTEIVNIYLKHGTYVNIFSPLCMMCEFRNAKIVRLFLDNGANVNLCNYEP